MVDHHLANCARVRNHSEKRSATPLFARTPADLDVGWRARAPRSTNYDVARIRLARCADVARTA
eukprot:11216950-Lingulodinium_polyedra.AAC.1